MAQYSTVSAPAVKEVNYGWAAYFTPAEVSKWDLPKLKTIFEHEDMNAIVSFTPTYRDGEPVFVVHRAYYFKPTIEVKNGMMKGVCPEGVIKHAVDNFGLVEFSLLHKVAEGRLTLEVTGVETRVMPPRKDYLTPLPGLSTYCFGF